MIIKKETPIVLYGAGEVGDIIGKNIKEKGYNLIGYIDRKNHGKKMNGVPIVDLYVDIFEKKTSVIIVCLADGTLHKDIANLLFELGYIHILFIPFGYKFPDETAREINEIYDSFYYGYFSSMELVEIKAYCDLINEEQGYGRYINFVNESWMNIYVDIEFLYTENLNLWEGDLSKIHGKSKYNDINVCSYRPYIALMDSLLGKGDFINEYWDAWDRLPFDKESRIKNREILVDEYEYHKSRNDTFFIESATKAVFNPSGYWNLHGGHHRIAYLIAKGEMLLPVKVRKEDYEKWKNVCAFKNYKEELYLLTKGIFKVKILHPAFIDYDAEREKTTNRIFKDVINHIDIFSNKEKSFLDVSDLDGLFSRIIIKQRLGEVDLLAKERTRIVQIIDKILNVNGVRYLSDYISNKKYDTLFCVNRFDELLIEKEFLLEKIASITKKILFIEINIEDFEYINKRLIDFGFLLKTLVHREMVNGKMKEIYCYEK